VATPLLAVSVSTCSPALVSAIQPASSGIALTLRPTASKSQVPSAALVSSSAAPLQVVTKELRQSKLTFAPASIAVAAVADTGSQSPTFPSSRQPDLATARVSEPALPAAQSAALKRAAAADKVAISPLKNCISNPIASTHRLASVSSAQSTSISASASAFSSSPFASVYLKASATAQKPDSHHHKSVSRSDELRQCLAPALSSRMYANDVTVESCALGHGGVHDQLHWKDMQCHWGSVACHASAATTTGSVRDLNQDRFCLAEMPGTGVVFGVFDGMCVLLFQSLLVCMLRPAESFVLTRIPISRAHAGHGILGELAAQLCANEIPVRLEHQILTARREGRLHAAASIPRALEVAVRDTNATLLSVAAAEQTMVSRLLARSESHATASLSSSSLHDMLLDYGSTAIVGVLVPHASTTGCSKVTDAPSSSQNRDAAALGADIELNSSGASTAISSPVAGTTLYLANVGDSQCVLFERLHWCDEERAENCQCVATRSDRDDASFPASSQSAPAAAPTRGVRAAAKRKAAATTVAATAGSDATSVPGVCWNWKFLNAEHNPTSNVSEQERVIRDGGKVFRNGAASGEVSNPLWCILGMCSHCRFCNELFA
jgi:serine/threonine protein phosphatase PrpC